jgi:hypothetical protein
MQARAIHLINSWHQVREDRGTKQGRTVAPSKGGPWHQEREDRGTKQGRTVAPRKGGPWHQAREDRGTKQRRTSNCALWYRTKLFSVSPNGEWETYACEVVGDVDRADERGGASGRQAGKWTTGTCEQTRVLEHNAFLSVAQCAMVVARACTYHPEKISM